VVWARRLAVALAIVALWWGVDWYLREYVTEYVGRIVIFCGINAILAVGLNLINGTTGQFSIGHAGFMAVGAYACAFTVIQLENTFGASLSAMPSAVVEGLFLTAGLCVGALCAGATGLLVGTPSLRLRGDYLAIVTLGFGEIIRLLFNNTTALGGATGYSGGRPMGLPAYTDFYWVAVWATLVVVLLWNLTYSTWGRALNAIREDEIAASAVGIPTTKLKVMAFVVSAMTTGVAGGLFALLQGTVRPDDFKMSRSVDMIVMIIIGGLGSVSGAVVGAIFVAVTLELMRDVQQYRLIAYALLLIILMIVRPEGILGRHELHPGRWIARLRGTKGA
jgi:branched-chain amino acid transport system permease protein